MSWKELISSGIYDRSADPYGFEAMPDSVAAMLDPLPADRLVELARTPGLVTN